LGIQAVCAQIGWPVRAQHIGQGGPVQGGHGGCTDFWRALKTASKRPTGPAGPPRVWA
jgi:hypothetical protein